MSPNWLSWVALAWVLAAGGWMLADLNQRVATYELGEAWGPAETERMMRPVGFFQFGVGLFLASYGQWATAPALLLWGPAQWAMFRFSMKFHEAIDKLDHPISSMTPAEIEEYFDGSIKKHKNIDETIKWLDNPLSRKDAKKLARASERETSHSEHDDREPH